MLSDFLVLMLTLFICFVFTKLVSAWIEQRIQLTVNHILNTKQSGQSIVSVFIEFIKTEQPPVALVLQLFLLASLSSSLMLIVNADSFDSKEIILELCLSFNFAFLISSIHQVVFPKKIYASLSNSINIFISLNMMLFFGVLLYSLQTKFADSTYLITVGPIYGILMLGTTYLITVWISVINFAWKSWVKFLFIGTWANIVVFLSFSNAKALPIMVMAGVFVLANIVFSYLEKILPQINFRFTENYALRKWGRINVFLIALHLIGFLWIV